MPQKRKDSSGRLLKPGEREKSPGRYEYRWTDRFGRRHSIYATSLNSLREQEAELPKTDYRDLSNDKRKLTLNDLYTLWKSVKKGLKPNTFQNYQYMYEKFAMNDIGNIKIMELKKSDIKKFYNRLYENGMKPATIDSVHSVIHQALDVAIDDDIIRYNPSDKALKELKMEHANENKKVKAMTQEEEALFVNYLYNSPRDQRWYPIFIVMMLAGLRVGETTGLQWSDIDFENNTIDVNKTLVYYDVIAEHSCRYIMNTTKTAAGKRKVEMIDLVKEALLMEQQFQKDMNIVCESNIDGYDDFVFLNRYGRVHNHGTLNEALKRVVRNCNEEVIATSKAENPLLLPKLHCHMLRQTFGTRLNDAGVNIKAMQALLGHSDLETTMQIYVDASSQIMSRATGEYEKMINNLIKPHQDD